MSTKQFLGLFFVLVSVGCGGSATTDASQGGGNKTPTAVKLVVRTNPAGTRTGAVLTTQPVIEVDDANGNIVSSGSVAVTASLGAGGGSLTGTTSVASINGVATFSDLVINGNTGTRTLVFSAPGLQSATSQSFTLTSQLLKSLNVLTTPSTTAQTLVPLTKQPVIELLDDTGQPYVAPTPVTASIAIGSAIVATGGTVTSDATGKATFTNLSLGALNGVVPVGTATLRFTAGTLTADYAVAVNCAVIPMTFGSTVTGAFANGDCGFGGGNLLARYFKYYQSTINAAGAAVVNVSSTAFHPEACVRGPVSTWSFCNDNGTGQVSEKALLNAGTFYAVPSVDSVGQIGAFTLSTASASSDITNCDYVLAIFTGQFSENLTSTDCKFTDTGNAFDDFRVPLGPGEGFIATFTAGFPLSVGVYYDTSYISTTSGFTAQLSYTNPSNTNSVFVQLVVTGLNGGQLGAYTFQNAMHYPSPDRAPSNFDTAFTGWVGSRGASDHVAIIKQGPLPAGPPPRR